MVEASPSDDRLSPPTCPEIDCFQANASMFKGRSKPALVLAVFGWVVLFLIMSQLAMAEQLPIKAYTTADGLPNNMINKIVRDSRGFLWFCTGEGLSRFDGYSFTNYGVDQGLPHTMVNDFLETRSGELWIGTNGGLVLFNPKGEPTARVVFANKKGAATPMFTVVLPEDEDRRSRAVNVLLEDRNGTIW